ncbi:MAG: sigma-54-dependent transcriptional regulator [Myxococcaceae bacterium]
MATTILLVDDEKNILSSLAQSLSLEGYVCETAQSGQAALDLLVRKPIDAVLMDVKMPDLDGLAVLERLSREHNEVPIILMSGHGTIETAVRATQLGARDFLEKPISRDRLLVALRNVLSHQAALRELEELKKSGARSAMVGKSTAMQRVYALIAKAAPSEGRVLITGENGTGKELIARAIHENSKRHRKPFIKLNCAAIPHELIESELFGHERGAFTGATSVRRGKFELAHEGTLFLDEIGDMPPSMQAKLLRVLQEGELERVGGSETIRVDVRTVAATHRRLESEIAAGRFREDLFYRLNVVQIHSPALRERLDDLPELTNTFLKEACERNGRRPLSFTPEALARLASHSYPGNVRELRNWVERLAILSEGPRITDADAAALLPAGTTAEVPTGTKAPEATYTVGPALAPPTTLTFREQVEAAERDIILRTLASTHDNATEAARLLNLERGHFYKKMKALGIRRGG